MKINKFIKMKKLLGIMLLATIAWSCENVKEYKDPTDNIPPGKVTSVKVENLHGGAMITYTLPNDNDLLGVKAVYTLREEGQEHEAYSSAHRDTIILAGFPDTNEHTVNLYAIDLSKNLSEPTPVTVNPLTPPVELIRRSLRVNETFSGVHCEWENTLKEDIAVSLLYVDSIGELTLDDTYFSNASQGKYSFRGYENKPYAFRLEIRDRWLNYATPLDTVLTPMYERQIPGRDLGAQMWYLWGFDNRECLSRGDLYTTSGTNRDFTILFDNILFEAANWWHIGNDPFLAHYVPGWTDNTSYPYPAYFTVDMSREANYSRLKIYMRARVPLFSANTFTAFELWGTNNPKPLIEEQTDEDRLTNLRYWTDWEEINGTGEWRNDWVKLGDFSVNLPSGATLATHTTTAEDQEFIRNGWDFNIDPDKTNVPCRYLRFVLKRYNEIGRRPTTQMGELQFFGSLRD